MGFKRLFIDLSWSSLFRWTPVISAARLQGARVHEEQFDCAELQATRQEAIQSVHRGSNLHSATRRPAERSRLRKMQWTPCHCVPAFRFRPHWIATSPVGSSR